MSFAVRRIWETNVVTTLDLDLQKTASDALGNNRGAVIAMEPDTGKILCMVSQPNFNANQVDEKWQELIAPDNTKAACKPCDTGTVCSRLHI